MAALALRNEEVRALEQARQALIQLTRAITTLQQSLAQSDSLPLWSSFQSQIKVVSQHIESFSKTIGDNDALLSRLAISPLPEFPGLIQEGLLGQLLRKKVEPTIEDWMQDGLDVGRAVPTDDKDNIIRQEDLDELWDWAPVTFQDELRQYLPVLGGNYTLEERAAGIENVLTGLRRSLPDTMAESSDEEDSDDDAMKEDSKPTAMIDSKNQESNNPQFLLKDQLKFIATGVVPPTARIPGAV